MIIDNRNDQYTALFGAVFRQSVLTLFDWLIKNKKAYFLIKDLENLSPELTRNFKLIYELDLRVHDGLIEIDKLKSDYLSNFKSMDNEARLASMKMIDLKYEKIKQFGDEKVQLANQTYELVHFQYF